MSSSAGVISDLPGPGSLGIPLIKSEYEARAYIALLPRHPLNGYELAKLSSLHRANIYGVLQKLEDRGAIIRLDTSEGTRYGPVPAEELIERLRLRFQYTLDTTQHALNELSSPAEYEYVGNVRGYPALLEHVRTLFDTAHEHLLLAVWPPEALNLAEPLTQAEQLGIDITTVCLAACPQECGGCRGRIDRYQVAPEKRQRWLVVVSDRAEVLTGEVAPNGESLAIRTRQRLLVELAIWYIRHSIAVAAIAEDLGSRLGELLDADTRSILTSLQANEQKKGWLEHMPRLAGRENTTATLDVD